MDGEPMVYGKFLVIFLLVGCGESFTATQASDGGLGLDVVEGDGRAASGGRSSTGDAVADPDAGEDEHSSGGTSGDDGGSGGASAGGSDGGASVEVPLPACCVDADCPASIPFCSPWGTCYQGGDPYNCDYDVFCESFCVHCSGSVAGVCDGSRCVCS